MKNFVAIIRRAVFLRSRPLGLTIIALLTCSANARAGSHQPVILLLPFTVLNGSAWIVDSVQQSLQADLRNSSIAHAPAAAVDDSAAIARIAHNASSDYVVLGHVQIIDDQVRLTASVFNDAGTSIGVAKTTGDLRRLFDLEDVLADQLRDAIAKTTAAKQAVSTAIPEVQGSGPIRMTSAKALPLGTVPQTYSTTALRDGRDRYLYQVPFYGCWGYGGFGLGGFGFGCGGVFNGSYSTGGQHALAW